MNGTIALIILRAILAAAVAALTIYVIPAAKSFIDKNKDTRLYLFVETAVRAAEQIYPGSGKGQEKKTYAMHLICKWLGQHGYDESYLEVIETMLEECVYMLKSDD